LRDVTSPSFRVFLYQGYDLDPFALPRNMRVSASSRAPPPRINSRRPGQSFGNLFPGFLSRIALKHLANCR
jgi:hypothetical protein